MQGFARICGIRRDLGWWGNKENFGGCPTWLWISLTEFFCVPVFLLPSCDLYQIYNASTLPCPYTIRLLLMLDAWCTVNHPWNYKTLPGRAHDFFINIVLIIVTPYLRGGCLDFLNSGGGAYIKVSRQAEIYQKRGLNFRGAGLNSGWSYWCQM